jgi:hypothetical protein
VGEEGDGLTGRTVIMLPLLERLHASEYHRCQRVLALAFDLQRGVSGSRYARRTGKKRREEGTWGRTSPSVMTMMISGRSSFLPLANTKLSRIFLTWEPILQGRISPVLRGCVETDGLPGHSLPRMVVEDGRALDVLPTLQVVEELD